MHNCFGIAIGGESMPFGNERIAKGLVIVDLTVEDHPNAAIFVRDRLMPSAQIDDAEPAHADAATAIDINAFIVWPAVANLIAHRPDGRGLSAAFAQHETSYSTHIGSRAERMIGFNYPSIMCDYTIATPSTTGLGQIRHALSCFGPGELERATISVVRPFEYGGVGLFGDPERTLSIQNES
jgi:hypothetical protein